MKNNYYSRYSKNTNYDSSPYITDEVELRQEFRTVNTLCKFYGFNCSLRFNQIHITTNCEAWYFIPRKDGIIKLYHGNSIGQLQNGYHKQFSRKMNYAEVLVYIKEHRDAKFKGIRNGFTFTKTGARKTAAMM